MECVLDSSMALAWALPDEASGKADGFLTGLSEDSRLWVPPLWWYELSNALTMALRRKRLNAADVLRLIELYRSLPVMTDTLLGGDGMYRFHVIAERHGLSAYDAAYLELAQRRGLKLATVDKRLISGARKAGVGLVKS
jgi:predicted nucleic acid-binding protein